MSRINVETLVSSIGLQYPRLSSRPSSPVNGLVYYNTTINRLEFWDGAYWRVLDSEFISASGGNTVRVLNGYTIHTFTGDGTFTVNYASYDATIDLLVVAGGGGGGGSTAGGGGAGGVIYKTNLTIEAGSYGIVVGGGGSGTARADQAAPTNTEGANSSAFGYTAIGGGRGFSGTYGYFGASSRPATGGGSGGGGGYYSGNVAPNGQNTYGAGTPGQGSDGGIGRAIGEWGGGGGGGAGRSGTPQGGTIPTYRRGGDGRLIDISGVPTYYGGGGGGGVYYDGANSLGGLGGGGLGGSGLPNNSTPGQANTGGGGGGGGYYQYGIGGSAGGSGIVIIRYKNS